MERGRHGITAVNLSLIWAVLGHALFQVAMLCQVTSSGDLLTFNAIDSHWLLSAFDKFSIAPPDPAPANL